jgi:hypothetical protein
MSPRDQVFYDSFRALGLHPYRSHVGFDYSLGCRECLDLCLRGCKSDAVTGYPHAVRCVVFDRAIGTQEVSISACFQLAEADADRAVYPAQSWPIIWGRRRFKPVHGFHPNAREYQATASSRTSEEPCATSEGFRT